MVDKNKDKLSFKQRMALEKGEPVDLGKHIEDINELAKSAIQLGKTKPMKAEENDNGELVISEIEVKSTIDESFGGEEGILEIFKGVYKHAKSGSVPHASFIMQWYFKGGEGEEGFKEFRIIEENVE